MKNNSAIFTAFLAGLFLLLFFNCKKEAAPTVPTIKFVKCEAGKIISRITSEVTNDGGSTVTERGICWSKEQNPTIAGQKTSDGMGSGKFTSEITGLERITTYYLRSYATNLTGTGYGDQVSAIMTNDSSIITDGSYAILQKATKGKGVDLVFIGDGYRDVDILSKKYANNIKLAVGYFFDIEPYKSYSAYFNVYMVYAISEESGISDLARTVKTKFETKFEGGTNEKSMTTNISTCRDFALKAPIQNIDNTVAILVANSTEYGGTTYIHSGQKGLNISVCPRPPRFANYIVQHEAGGHGFGNLADEYVKIKSWIPRSEADILIKKHKQGVFLNIDLTKDPRRVLWTHFYGLPNYSYVNVYEGGYLYSQGVWRPEKTSLMAENIKYFNAPSRELIVKRIMKLAELTYSFADFQVHDIMELSTKAAILPLEKSLQLPPPVIMN